MGEERFTLLRGLLQKETLLVGIDEHTAVIFDFKNSTVFIEGKGAVTMIKGNSKTIFIHNKVYDLASFCKGIVRIRNIPKDYYTMKEKLKKKVIKSDKLSSELKDLLTEREEAKKYKNFVKADAVRKRFEKEGYSIEDSKGKQYVYKNNR